MLFNLKKIIAYQAIWRTPTILSNAYVNCLKKSQTGMVSTMVSTQKKTLRKMNCETPESTDMKLFLTF